MFWRVTSLSATSPVDTILDKEHYTVEELLDEDEIIQECKALNPRLINFFRERTQVEQLLRYIVEEGHEDAEKKHTFKFPFMSCEIITCEVDVILKTLVDDEELMTLLFSFLKPDRSHGLLLAGYFSKVVICLMLRKTVPLMKFLQDHQDIFQQLVDLIGITSIMEVLIRLIGADEHMYSSYMDAMKWLGDTTILEMIVDKFSSSDSPEVHANVAETLCAITRCAPPALAAKIFSPSFVGRLFRHALEDCRPKSVFVYSLTVCISLLDPKRPASTSYHSFRVTHGSVATTSAETFNVMLENLGDVVKLLDTSSSVMVLPTTYGSLQPPLGNLRLKIVEFISVLLTVGNEDTEKELIRLGTIKCVLDLFFEYPFHNFLHHHVECIILSCLESTRTFLVEHLFVDCVIVSRILGAEKSFTLSANPNKPTVPADGRLPPRIGNIGHITRISNKLAQLADNNDIIKMHLQENNEWADWYTNVLLKRNSVENIYQWVCGRPTTVDRDDDDDDFKDRAFDIATFLRDGLGNDDMDEAHLSLEQDDEDGYFADSAEVIFSSLRLGNDHERLQSFTSPSSSSDESDDVIVGENVDFPEAAASSQMPGFGDDSVEPEKGFLGNFTFLENGFMGSEKSWGQLLSTSEFEKPPEWIEWGETSDSSDIFDAQSTPLVSNGELEGDKNHLVLEEAATNASKPSPPPGNVEDQDSGGVASTSSRFQSSANPVETSDGNQIISPYEIPRPSGQSRSQPFGIADAETVVT